MLTRGPGVRSTRGCGPLSSHLPNHHLPKIMAQPIRTGSSPNEGSILLALSALQSNQFRSVSAAAKAFNVSKTTLLRRRAGATPRADFTPRNMRLTPVEEEILTQMILQLDSQGLSPTVALITDLANTICKAKGKSIIRKNWATTFVQRSPALQIKMGRSYECQRKLCEDPELITGWFELVKNTINKYGIQEQDIYNFDETGFQMGQISASMVVTASDRQGRPKQVKPTNTQWVTLVQGACADGWSIPPFIIFKGKILNQAWLQQGLPSTWVFAVSPNGWTSNELGLQWIQHFEEHTKDRRVGSRRLLILDNHGSHTTPEFRSFCEKKNIILLWMPPYSSHLLQPLDIGCFGPLKQAFSKLNQGLIRNHIFHITKEDFLATFYQAFNQAFTLDNIKGGFRGSGLVPFNPDEVLSRLDPVLNSPEPPSERSWQAQTPSNSQQVEKQATLIKKKLQRHQSSSPSPIFDALDQLSKGAQILATSVALLGSQVASLQQANQDFHQRRKRTRRALKTIANISVTEAQELVVQNQVEARIMQEAPKPKRAALRCSKCNSFDHNARTCTISL